VNEYTVYNEWYKLHLGHTDIIDVVFELNGRNSVALTNVSNSYKETKETKKKV
jgi:hypothetical protein